MADVAKGGFWTTTSGLAYAPKQQHLFKVYIEGFELEDDENTSEPFQDARSDTDFVWYAKSVDKPTISLQVVEKDEVALGDRVSVPKFAKVPNWEPITMTLVDPSYPNASRKLMRLFRRAGYLDMKATKAHKPGAETAGFDKKQLLKAVGSVRIQQLDRSGIPLETWELYQAVPSKVNFGKLDYSSDDLVEISVEFHYTAAFVTFHGKSGLKKKHDGNAMQKDQGYDGQMTERGFTYQTDYKESAEESLFEDDKGTGGTLVDY